jgi:predicted MPP superfamily phosphohydrolase
MLLSWCLYLYTYQGVQTFLNSFSHTVQKVIEYAYWLFFITLHFILLNSIIKDFRTKRFGKLFQVAIHVYVIVFVSQLVFSVLLLSEDLYRLTYSIIASFNHSSPTGHLSRSHIVSEIGIFLATLPMLSFVYGMVKGKYKYTVHQQTLYFKDLPEEFDGFTITQISDVHAGSFDDPQAVQRGIDLIKAQNSDLFVFTGDLVNNEAKEIEPWINHFNQIKAPEGRFSILGNHDYGDYIHWNSLVEKENNLDLLKEHHKQIGFHLLLDEHINITRGNQSIKLIGVENWGVGFGKRGDLGKALQGTQQNDFKILLSHDPSHWTSEVKTHPSNIHLTLSGHTHGMQFGIEKFGIKWSPVKYRYPHWAGLIKENDRHLYVNRGFGFLGFSGRVGIWPEITVLTLKRQ